VDFDDIQLSTTLLGYKYVTYNNSISIILRTSRLWALYTEVSGHRPIDEADYEAVFFFGAILCYSQSGDDPQEV
jgi:hypothetical protein